MGTYDDEAPRLSEIVRMLQGMDRKFDDFRNQMRDQLADKVSKDKYEGERDRIYDRLTVHDTRFTALENRTRAIANAIYGSVGSLIVGALLLYLGTRS